MNPYPVTDEDLNVESHPMRRLPVIHSILYDVTSFSLSEYTVEAETENLRRNGFVVASVSRRFDPGIGHITEYWGYNNRDHEDV